jgi:cobyrinic acid a,c-diamide synthase
MYLSKEVAADKSFCLCDVLPASAEMTGKIQALGYVQGETVTNSSCFPAGLIIRGHEFHYSRLIPDSDARYAVVLHRGNGIENGCDGLVQGSAVGTYTHTYFSNDFARHFVQSCIRQSRTW